MKRSYDNVPTVRAIALGAWAGGSIGLLGYDLELILRDQATRWNYILFGCGLVGLILLVLYRKAVKRRLRRGQR